MWSVGLSQYSETYVNLKCNRVVLNYAQLGKMDKLKEGHPEFNYVVVHYDQVSFLSLVCLQFDLL